MKAPELLDLVLLAGEKQAVELLPLDADDEAGHQGGEESHQDAQRQVPAVCSEETNAPARLMENCTEVYEFCFKGQRVWLTAPSCGKESTVPALQLGPPPQRSNDELRRLLGRTWATSASVCKHLFPASANLI